MVEPRGREFVCSIHREYAELMIPINKSMSIIANYRNKDTADKVPIYKKIKAKERGKLEITGRVPHKETVNGKYLFVVQYLDWRRDFPHPLGIVTGRLPKGDNLSDALKILYTEYGVKNKFPKRVISEGKAKLASPIPEKEREERPRVDGAFTIDPPESKDLDDALTVEETSDGNLKVGIHIADVSYYVQKDSVLDEEARKRCTSYYPHNDLESIPMLPRELSEGLCSLLPGRDRLTVSIFLHLDKEGKVLRNPEFRRTIVRSSCRLTYAEAQEIILRQDITAKKVSDLVVKSIGVLHDVAQMRRRMRLGDAAISTSEAEDEDFEAHQLVEEMMILANQIVATFLKEKSSEFAVLRTQLPPKNHRLSEWREKYGRFAKHSLCLKKHIPEGNEGSSEERFMILTSIWSAMLEAVHSGDHEQLRQLICNDWNHPQLAIAHANFHRIQAKAEYVCVGELQSDQQSTHFSMQSVYTHFTSPIRRYIDIVVHRLLLSLCNTEKGGIDLQPQQVASACRRCTFCSRNATKFERECAQVYMADKIQKTSGETLAFISAVEKDGIELQLATSKEAQLSGKERKMQISHLGPIGQPKFDDVAMETQLEWKLRLYLAPCSATGPSGAEEVDEVKQMLEDSLKIKQILGQGKNNKEMVQEIPANEWVELLNLVISNDYQCLGNLILKANQTMRERGTFRQPPHLAEQPYEKEAEEDKAREEKGHFYNKSLNLKMGDVVTIQLAPQLIRGILTPDIQLLQLTPKIGICLEHRKYARDCFAESVTQVASKTKYKSLQQYVEAWVPVLAVEAAREAVQADDVFTILGWKVKWSRQPKGKVVATFELTFDYCTSRHIDFSVGDFICARVIYHVTSRSRVDNISDKIASASDGAGKDTEEVDDESCSGDEYHTASEGEDGESPPESYNVGKPSSLHTVREENSNSNAQIISKNQVAASSREKRCWVGHCIVKNVNKDEKKQIVYVNIQLHRHSCKIPDEIFCGAVDESDFEVIRRTIPQR